MKKWQITIYTKDNVNQPSIIMTMLDDSTSSMLRKLSEIEIEASIDRLVIKAI